MVCTIQKQDPVIHRAEDDEEDTREQQTKRKRGYTVLVLLSGQASYTSYGVDISSCNQRPRSRASAAGGAMVFTDGVKDNSKTLVMEGSKPKGCKLRPDVHMVWYRDEGGRRPGRSEFAEQGLVGPGETRRVWGEAAPAANRSPSPHHSDLSNRSRRDLGPRQLPIARGVFHFSSRCRDVARKKTPLQLPAWLRSSSSMGLKMLKPEGSTREEHGLTPGPPCHHH